MKTNGVGENFEQKWEGAIDELKAIVNDLCVQNSLKPANLSELYPRFSVVFDTLKGYQMQNVPLEANSYLDFKLELAIAVFYNNLCYHVKANQVDNNTEDYNPINLNQEDFEEGRELVTGYLKAVRSSSVEDFRQPIGSDSWGEAQALIANSLAAIRKEEEKCAQLDLELQLAIEELLGAESSCREAD
jgi:hypothetical protein